MIRFVVIGAPRSKKCSDVLFVKEDGHPGKVPSKAWSYWCRHAVFAMPDGRTVLQPPYWVGECSINAQFYMDAARYADAVNLYQGLADLLQTRHCVENDFQFKNWDGSRVHVDRVNPRVEVTLTEIYA